MFDLNDEVSGFSKATSFYEYAKALAILRENYMRRYELPSRASEYNVTIKIPVNEEKILKQINEAISALVKQIQE